MRNLNYVFLLLAFLLGGIASTLLCRKYYKNKILLENPNYNPDNMPDSIGVKLDSTNLPIVFINTNGEHVERDQYITAQMTIIDNGEGMSNYGDTIVHPDQVKDFEGFIAIKYRGMNSFSCSPKKPYAIRALDKPLSEGGKKKKSKLLGMRKGKKWALDAVRLDRSMIRNALSFELARPYMEFVPQTRFCEIIVDGIYRGIYSLSEQITADRLKLEKPGDDSDALTGGYLLQIDRREKNGAYISPKWDVGYRYEYPDSGKLSSQQKTYINHMIDEVEKSLLNKDMLKLKNKIDVQSMVDFQLMVEFSYNGDSYDQSTFIYKYRDNEDSRFKFCMWDFDLGYGNSPIRANGNGWVYNLRKYWWAQAMEYDDYSAMVHQRWRQYRETNFSDEHIEQVIDSLTKQLTICGAEKRNSEAWEIWKFGDWRGPRRICCEKYMSVSYEDEIEYLKEWINKRLTWMDKELLE